MVKDDTILYLGLGGAALYLLSRTDFFNGLGGVGSGVGDAVQGLGTGVNDAFRGVGSGLGTIGREAGDLVSNLTAPTDLLGSIFGGAAGSTQQFFEQQQRQNDFVEATKLQGALDREQIRQAEQTNRTQALQSQFTQTTNLVTQADDAVLSYGKSVVDKFKQFTEVGSNVFFSPFTTSALSGSVGKALVDAAASTASRTFDTVKEAYELVNPVKSRSVRTSSGGQTLAPTPREVALQQSLPASERNKPAQSLPTRNYTPAPAADLQRARNVRTPSIISRIGGFFGRFF